MDRITALGRGTQIMLVAGALLLVSLFLPWERIPLLAGEAVEFTGWHGTTGVLLGISTIALLAWIVLRVVASQVLQSLPFSQALVSALLGAAVVLFGLLRFLVALGDSATWAYVGLVLVVLVGVGAWLTLRSPGRAS